MRSPAKSTSREAQHRTNQGKRGESPAPSQALTDAAARFLAALGLSEGHAARKSATER